MGRRSVPGAEVARAVLRPETYPGHARELLSLAATVVVWPTGRRDAGVPAYRDRSRERAGVVESPVLLVHGYGANKSNWFAVRRYLQSAGFGHVHGWNYSPLRGDIPELAEGLRARAEALRDFYGTEGVHLVGHSLGGIVVRYAVAAGGLVGARSAVTVASPHGGVRLAGLGRPIAGVEALRSGLQLDPRSEVLRTMRAAGSPAGTRWTAYYSNMDLIVRGRRAQILEPELAAANILVKDQGHLSILWSRRLASSVADQLAAAEGLPGYGRPLGAVPAGRPAASPAAGERRSAAGG